LVGLLSELADIVQSVLVGFKGVGVSLDYLERVHMLLAVFFHFVLELGIKFQVLHVELFTGTVNLHVQTLSLLSQIVAFL